MTISPAFDASILQGLSEKERGELNILVSKLQESVRKQRLRTHYWTIHNPDNPHQIKVYPWQIEFHNAGAKHNQRMLIAANQVGKTRSAAAEVAMHATGIYPPWWQGKRFNRGVKIWVGSTTNEKSRDIVQEALLGPIGEWGSGWVQGDRLIGKPKMRQAGVPDVVDSFYVAHACDDISKIALKTYEQGRESWQGTGQDVIWFDEEPPHEIYSEGLTRTVATGGIMLITFTPLLGVSDVVHGFLNPKEGTNYYVKNVTWEDAPHLTQEKKAELRASYNEFEVDARTRGTPLMARGLIFPIADERIVVDPFQIPRWWARINGIDFGFDHPTAGAYLAHDRESDTIYLYDCYKLRGETPVHHAAQMKKHGEWIPTAWPRDGLQRDKGSGQQLKDQYRGHGLFMLREHATYRDDRGEHVEPGLIEMYEYMRDGKFKVFSTCTAFLEEKRFYHRDEDGKIVKERDDIISATRYGFMMRRFATTEPPKVAVSKAPQLSIMGRRF